jgi:peptidyl-prolyl cis-trans isomerase A (cyclophilin A)
MKTWLALVPLAIATLTFAQEKPTLRPGVYAVFETSMGNITCELYQRQAPQTVANFIGLAEGTKDYKDPRTGKLIKGKPYYNGLTFHRVIDNFMIQSGDPTGTGTGGPGYNIPDEVARDLNFAYEGRLAMANAGRPGTGGAQFFITVAPRTSLNGGYTIFGQVVDGMDVVKKIAKVPTKPQANGEKSRPVTDVLLKKVTIQRIK